MSLYVHAVFIYFIVFAASHAALIVMAAIQTNRFSGRLVESGLRRTARSPLAPGISILVPAYNESAGIVDSVRSLLALEYNTFEIVIVNDGSSDDTLDQLVAAFDLVPATIAPPPRLGHKPVRGVFRPRGRLNLRIVDKENGGKADALNAGITYARFPLFCAIDADSILEQDALLKTVIPFLEDSRTIASGGIVRVANGCTVDRGRLMRAELPRTTVPMLQVVEYLRAFFAARAAWSLVNGLAIVSGAFGLFDRREVLAAGGYRTDTVGEDMELVVRLHRRMHEARRPYRIVYVPDPVCWTEAPSSLRVLRRQRRRWSRGSCETLIMHRRMLFNPRYGTMGSAALPSLLLFDILGPVVELSGYAVAAWAAATGSINPPMAVLFFLGALLYGLFLSIGAVALEEVSFGRHPGWDDLGRILFHALVENLGFRQLTLLWRIEGFLDLWRRGDWGHMERSGFAAAPPVVPVTSATAPPPPRGTRPPSRDGRT